MPTVNYSTPKWWKEAVIYQIYPASFKDSNDDGWGDIPGILSELDYLKELGVDVVWSSPIYKSPQVDMGYDISDYRDIDPRYGTLQDVETLIKELGARDMKLMMDLVVNHTSDQHAWFQESRASKDAQNPKRDWYVWRPAKYDDNGTRMPPNNWAQLLKEGSSAWTWDEKTEEYYLTLWTPEQVDLNWENPAVREAVHDILRFWLSKGVCGFRMDVINMISKTPGLPDADVIDPDVPYQHASKHFANGPRLHEYLRGIHDVLNEYNAISVGEMPWIDDEDEILKIVQPDRKELDMIFVFDIVEVDMAAPGSRRATQTFKRSKVRELMSKWQKTMMSKDGWNSLYIENHDGPRSVSRYMCDTDATANGAIGSMREVGAKLLALMLTTLSGTLFVYQGQELGMKNLPASWPIDEYKDVASQTTYENTQRRYDGKPEYDEAMKECMEDLQRRARDNCRIPVQWTAARNAGFCKDTTQPWMRVNEDIETCNAEAQIKNKDSVLQYWKEALVLRKEYANVFVYGDFELVGKGQADEDNPVFAYRRWTDTEEFIVVLNFSGETLEWVIPDSLRPRGWKSPNYERDPLDQEQQETLVLRPWEAILGMKQV